MHHYVFWAAINHPANAKSIKIAKSVVDYLKKDWGLEADNILCNYHSDIRIIEINDSIEIMFDNDNIIQLIDDCMEFARLKERFDRIYNTLDASMIE